MKLSILVAVVLRIFALYWLVTGVVTLLSVLGAAQIQSSFGTSYGWLLAALPLLMPVGYLTLAMLAWVFAAAIARRAVGAIDPQFRLVEVTPAHFYSIGVLLMGLFYFLSYLAASVNWIHYAAMERAGDAILQSNEGHSLYEVSSNVIPCIAGAALAILAPKIGHRMARWKPLLPRPAGPEEGSPPPKHPSDSEHPDVSG